MPSLSSFINSSQFSTESTTTPLLAGMVLGSTYAGVTFSGISGAVSVDPGGVFGWLIYSRSTVWGSTGASTPAKGTTSDQYIVYTSPQQFVGDLNQLSGVTSCLVTTPNAGGTYAFFQTAGTVDNSIQLSPLAAGKDFLFAINYLAYGGTLVVAGNVNGFDSYTAATGNYLDAIIGQEGNTTNCQWLIDQPYTVGIFPSIADAAGVTGNGYTLANYATLLGSSSLVSGTTVANRLFNVYGVKTVSKADTTTLLSNSKITYTIPAVSDVGGFFTRSKNRNEEYLTVAGIDRSTILNGNITNSIDWQDSLKNTLRTNRVNFFVNYNPKFLGSDLVGATANPTLASDDRIGPSRLRSALNEVLTGIGLKYLFDVNNATTRAQITSEIETGLDPFTPYIDTTKTQIICDSSNNTDNSATLNMSVVIKPILSIDSFAVNITLTQ
jgi:hypothetical protein